jgi:solute carrier family 25 phosphate transporter 23/24/25/41
MAISAPVFELGEVATVNRLSPSYLATHRPIALMALVPRAAVLFGAGAVSGAIAKSLTAPLDRVKVRAACH